MKHMRAAISVVCAALATAQVCLAANLAQLAGPDGLDLRLDVIALSFVICTVSGAAALLQRINSELQANPDHRLPRPLLFCSMHMMGSWAAGLLAFVLAQSVRMEVWSSLSLLIVASYAGARFLEAYVEAKMPKSPPSAPDTQAPPPSPQGGQP